MCKKLLIILFYTSGLVLVLHNITPHAHDQVTSDSDRPHSILEWLTFAFQLDPGAGHLECFSKPDQLEVSEDDLVKLQLPVFVYHDTKESTSEAYIPPFAPVLLSGIELTPHVLSLRGPPV